MTGIGSSDLSSYRKGRKVLTRRTAMLAMCADCNGNYADKESRDDCLMPTCPLYKWMPYRQENITNSSGDAI